MAIILIFLNPQPRRGCLEIREEGGEVFISLLVIFLTIIFLNLVGLGYMYRVYFRAIYYLRPTPNSI
jgi:hypothetical protein